MKRAKRTIKFVSILLMILSFCFNAFSYENPENSIKKVISIAYDDSGSMSSNGQDYSYASYGLQNIIGLMNPQDKLNVVKMSDMNKNNTFHIDNYDKRKSELEDVKTYRADGKDTNFQTVRTAVDYLLDMKSVYGEDNNYEYYLVVMTDGQFDNYPSNLTKYLSEIPREFGSSIYNGIFIGIGNNVPSKLEKDVLDAPNNYYVESGNNDEIVNALYVAHDIIYNRTVIPEEDLHYNENNSSLFFDAKDNINRIIVFEQNQQVPVINITTTKVEANEKLMFTGIKKTIPTLDSYVLHASNPLMALPKGRVTLNFLDDIDKSNKRFRVMVEYESDANRNILNNNQSKPRPNNDSADEQNNANQNGQGKKDGNINNDGKGNSSGTTNGKGNTSGNISGNGSVGGNISRNSIANNGGTVNGTGIESGKGSASVENGVIIKESLDEKSIDSGLGDAGKVRSSKEFYGAPIVKGDDTIERDNNKVIIGDDILDDDGVKIIIGPGGCGIHHYTFGLSGCARLPYEIGLSGCTRCSRNEHYNVRYYGNPIWPLLYTLLSLLPFLLLLLLLYGYLKKPRFDRKYHDFVVKRGNKVINDGSMIRVKFLSKLPPFYAERGYGSDLFIKASKYKDRVIVPKKYLSSDMKVNNMPITICQDLTLFEDNELTKGIGNEALTYIYRSRPYFEKNIV